MIIEQRTYTVHHGTMDTYLARYEKYALPLQLNHLGHLIGFYVSEVGTLNQVTHLWAFRDFQDREDRRARLAREPAWKEFLEMNRGSFVHQDVRIYRPTSFSPLPELKAESQDRQDKS